MTVKTCGRCHGKGEYQFIKRISFGPDAMIDARTQKCEQCEGEGKIFVCPASKAPKEVA